MIHQLTIANWRSYRRLDLNLRSGATFIVAPNGIGKTSIIEAARFVIFGHLPNRPGFRSLGADGPTEVTATVGFGDGPDLVITRTVATRRGAAPLVSAVLGDKNLDGEDLDRLLAERFGGPVDFLDRLSIVQSSDIIRSPDTLDLRAHLGDLLGIGGIDSAIDDTHTLLTEATSRVGQQREAVAVSADEVRWLAGVAGDAVSRLAVAERAVADAKLALDQARAAVREADRVTTLAALVRERDNELDAIAAEAGDLIGAERAQSDLDAALAAVEAAAVAATDERRRRRAELQGRIDAVLGALSELSGATGSCPVCRRPLDDADVAHARTAHEADVASWRTELAGLDAGSDEQILVRVRQLRTRLARVAPAVELPADAVDAEAAATGERAAVSGLERAMTVAAGVRAEADAARREHAAATDAASALNEVVAAFEQVATLEAVEQGLSAVRTVLLDEGIEPLADALGGQWEKLFENRPGLLLGGDGALSRSVGGETLELGGFSDGERMAAQLLVRIVVLNATTRLPFLWIDEPLEHLDPDARRALALVLARAPGEGGVLKQVVMTTYEEPLVRRLSGVVPNTRMLFVRPPT